MVGVECPSFLKKEGGLTVDIREGKNEWRAPQFSFVNIPSHFPHFVFLFNGATGKFEVIYVTCITVDTAGLAEQGREAKSSY